MDIQARTGYVTGWLWFLNAWCLFFHEPECITLQYCTNKGEFSTRYSLISIRYLCNAVVQPWSVFEKCSGEVYWHKIYGANEKVPCHPAKDSFIWDFGISKSSKDFLAFVSCIYYGYSIARFAVKCLYSIWINYEEILNIPIYHAIKMTVSALLQFLTYLMGFALPFGWMSSLHTLKYMIFYPHTGPFGCHRSLASRSSSQRQVLYP